MKRRTTVGIMVFVALGALVGAGYYAFVFVKTGIPDKKIGIPDQASPKQSIPPTIRIGTLFTALDYGPYFIARRNGWFEESLEGKGKIEYLATFQAPPTANEAMAAGEVDMVLTADVPAIVGRAAGVQLRIPWLSCTLHSQVVVPAEAKSKVLADLRGKRIGVAFGTGPHYGILKHLGRLGLSDRDVQLLDMIPPDAKAAFHARAVDAWAIFPPWIEQELVAGSGKVLTDVDSPVQVVVAVRRDAMREMPELVKASLMAMGRAKKWIKEHPEKSQRMLSEELDLPMAVVELAWPRLDWAADLTDETVRSDLQSKADFMANEGYVKKKLDVGKGLILEMDLRDVQETSGNPIGCGARCSKTELPLQPVTGGT